jgi:hypothetical protein
MAFRIREPPAIAHEAVAGEWIVISFETGKYFSIEGAAADAFALLKAKTETEIVDLLSARSGVAPDVVAAGVRAFIEQLQAERIIELADAPEVPDFEWQVRNHRELKFELGVHAELSETLLLDPIHEVSTEGWPERAPT